MRVPSRPPRSDRAGVRQSDVTGLHAANAYGAYPVEGPPRRHSLWIFLLPVGRREHILRTRTDLLDSYHSYLALQRGLSGHIMRACLVDINDLLSFLGISEGDAESVDAALATLNLADLWDWLAAVAVSGHSRATLARRSASVRTFSSWAFEAGLLTSDTTVRLHASRVDSRLPGVLMTQQAP